MPKAFDLAKTAHNLAPDDPDVAQVLGRVAFAMRDYPWSLSLLKLAAARHPNDPELLFDLAQAFYSVGGVSDAEAAMRNALGSHATFGRAKEAAAFLDLVALEEDPARAISEADRIDKALKAEPDNVPALMAMGEAFEQRGNRVAAIQEYEKALAHYPDLMPAERHLIILYSRDPAYDLKGFELATKAREAFPDDAQIAKACGIVVYRHKEYRRAEDLLEDGLKQLPNDGEVVFYLGMARYRLKDKSSKATLEHALGMDLRQELETEARRTLAEIK